MGINQLGYIILGALLATGGGALIEWVKILLDQKRKSGALKSRLFVAIDKSVREISSLLDSYDQGEPPLIHGAYIEKLKGISVLYDQTLQDLYLLDRAMRNRVMEFFDKQNALVTETSELVSTSETSKEAGEIQAEHDRKISAFRSLKSEGERLLENLQ